MRDKHALSRRRFIVSVAATAAGITAFPRVAEAGDSPKLAEDDPTAIALTYVHDATRLAESVRPGDRFCSNCALYQGAANAAWAPCSIFPAKQVAGRGWCSVWAPRQSG